MAIIGYITDIDTIDAEDLVKTQQVMKELNCVDIYTESTKESTERPRLKYILENAQAGDTIVFHKLSNALANTVELTNIFRLCLTEKVRIISVFDHIDTLGIFYKTTSEEFIRLLSTFNGESYMSKHRLKKLKDIPDSVKKIEQQRSQDEKEVQIVNMYMAECTYEEIMDALHIGSTRTIFKVLEKYNIPRSRQRYNRLQGLHHASANEIT